MRLSTKGRYGLRAMVDLAAHGDLGPVPIQAIAKRQELSEKYLEQLLGMLKKAGLVRSIRGTAGGYQVQGNLNEISVGDILRALEGDLAPVDCTGCNVDSGCKTANSCVSKFVWQKMNDSMESTVNHIYLNELAEQARAMEAQIAEEQ